MSREIIEMLIDQMETKMLLSTGTAESNLKNLIANARSMLEHASPAPEWISVKDVNKLIGDISETEEIMNSELIKAINEGDDTMINWYREEQHKCIYAKNQIKSLLPAPPPEQKGECDNKFPQSIEELESHGGKLFPEKPQPPEGA